MKWRTIKGYIDYEISEKGEIQRKWLNDKIIECEKIMTEKGENRKDEILYLKEFLNEI